MLTASAVPLTCPAGLTRSLTDGHFEAEAFFSSIIAPLQIRYFTDNLSLNTEQWNIHTNTDTLSHRTDTRKKNSCRRVLAWPGAFTK